MIINEIKENFVQIFSNNKTGIIILATRTLIENDGQDPDNSK